MTDKHNDHLRRLEEFPARIYVIFAVLTLGIYAALCTYTKISPALSGLSLIVAYLVFAAIFYLAMRRRLRLARQESDAAEQLNKTVIHAFHTQLNLPYAVLTESGRIVTFNRAMREITDRWDTVFHLDIAEVCGHSVGQMLEAIRAEEEERRLRDADRDVHIEVTGNEDANADEAERVAEQNRREAARHRTVTVRERLYRPEFHSLFSDGKKFYMLILRDVTDLEEVRRLYHNDLTGVGFIALDNLGEIAQYVQSDYQQEARQVEQILKEWAASLGGVVREYDRNHYMLFLSREMLEACDENNFKVLDTVRSVRLGEDNVPITVSIGIATTGKTLAERERDALVALDMALQRGGDTVALKSEAGFHYYGGKTKGLQKRSGGQARIVANRLCSMIRAASNVVVMGHCNPDFDSIGACVGIAALANYLGTPVKIVADVRHDNFRACTSELLRLEEYRNMFVDSSVALNNDTSESLLIVVDANNFRILEAPELAYKSFNLAVIDHHIKKEAFESELRLSYIDHTASSTCEMVAEILDQCLPVDALYKEEANVMMAGIMVDTTNFTRAVGTRTFAAALYLRSVGASTEDAREFFDAPIEDYHTEAGFGRNAKLYRENIAITSLDDGEATGGRVAAAKAADRLLTIRNVKASFALMRIGNVIHVSARSDGDINVQLILEKIGGGGHFDMAGAALADTEIAEAEAMIIRAIDAYLEER